LKNFLGEDVYCNIGEYYRRSGKPHEALEAYEKYLEHALEVQDKRLETIAYNNMGVAYSDLGEFQKAHEFFSKSLNMSEELGYGECEIETLIWKAEAYLKEGEKKSGLECLNDSIRLSGKKGGAGRPQEILKDTAIELAAKGEFEKATWFLNFISEKYPEYFKNENLQELKSSYTV
jgi:tetratricopeptide (TPR) repeat protein